MVEILVSEGSLVLHVKGADQLWALKSSLEIPLQHVAGIRADPSVAHGWWHGLRMPGTNLPGVIIAGTFYHDGKRVFWDVHNPENTVVIELKDERYGELIVEVADPNKTVEVGRAAL
jgi:Bacterial PH domain